jgi:hypothetical protein
MKNFPPRGKTFRKLPRGKNRKKLPITINFPKISPNARWRRWVDSTPLLHQICFLVISIPQPANSTLDIFSNIQGMIKWYLILGGASILCYWIGFSLWV